MQRKRSGGCIRQYINLFIVVVVGLFTRGAWAQPSPDQTRKGNIENHQAQEQRNVLPSSEIPQSREITSQAPADQEQARPAVSPSVDETTLWKFLRQQRYQQVRREIRRLQRTHRHWRPPQRLLSLVAEGEARQAVELAIQQREWERLLTFVQRYPKQFTCSQIHHLWALADAYDALAQSRALFSVYEGIISECKKATDRLATLWRAQAQLSPEAMESLLRQEAHIAKDEAMQIQFEEIRYSFYASRLNAILQDADVATVSRYEEYIRTQVLNKQDANMALLFGWSYFRAHRLMQAEEWFRQAAIWDVQREDAIYGLALTQFERKNFVEAEALARQWADASEKMRDLLGEVLLARARESRNKKKFGESLTLVQESEHYRAPTRETGILKAWNFYDLGETAQAAEEFTVLYRSQADDETAQGVLYSYTREQDWEGLAQVTHDVPGPLTPLWLARLGQRQYDHKLFLLARQTTPETFPQLLNLESPTTTSGVAFRFKSGNKGLGKLEEEILPFFEGSLVYKGIHRLSLQLHRVTLNAGALPANARIGSLPQVPSSYNAEPTTRLKEGWEPRFTYTLTGWLAPYAELGWTPIEGVIPAKPTWRLGILHRQEYNEWQVEAFSQPVRESLLSYTGIRDPYSGTRWGQVRQTGVRLSMFAEVKDGWGVSSHTSLATLRGQGVANNYHMDLGVGLAKTLTPRGFDYLALGPRLSFDHYEKNLGQFTLGHGGYFSPNYLLQFTTAAHFLTQESRQFIIMGDISAGIQVHQEESSPFFPRHPDGRRYSTNNENGPVFSAELAGVWQLSRHWQIGIGGIVRKTANYDDQAVMFFLRFLLDPREVTVSTDLSPRFLQALY